MMSYKEPSRLVHPLDYHGDKIYVDRGQFAKLKLILLCHSSAVEASMDKTGLDLVSDERISATKFDTYEDEYGKCSTFSKIGIPANDRVITLKKIIETKFGISCNDQILVYKDNVLKNDLKPLSFYRLKQYSRIHIFDQRDIKENASDDDLFGIYQDASLNTLIDAGKQHEDEQPVEVEEPSKARISSNASFKQPSTLAYKPKYQQAQPHHHQQHQHHLESYKKYAEKKKYHASRKHHSKSDESNESCEYEDELTMMDMGGKVMVGSRKKLDSYHLASICSSKQSAYSQKHPDQASRVRRLDEIFDQKLAIHD